ncbi:MAG TPA: 3',5'-nucleoside bisphosphate phosphatase [Burkholderiaceae bacterium]|nr:3',5'-nucleoside bisphosphate phosphatase [Burkholderiaceae bacterium]
MHARANTSLANFDPYAVNVDLHCHSNVSDGVLAPEEVVERAARNGVAWIALTDHDEVGGLDRAHARARELGIGFIAGVEVSVTWAGKTIHVVGLGIDRTQLVLNEGLARTRHGRTERAKAISDALALVGIEDAYEGAMRYVANPDLISRSHFARYLVELGVCDDMREVFGRYLVEGKPGYVPHRWARLSEAVQWIRAAGGEAVVAHPARYRFSDFELHTFFEEFVAAGGVGVEVTTSAHTQDETRRYAKLARDYGLRASRGSDFHSPNESRVDVGALPPLPDAVEPIWAAWGIG